AGRTFFVALDAEGGALALGLLYTGVGQPAIGRARADGQGGLLVDFTDVEAPRIHIDVRLKYRGLELTDAALQPSRHRHGRAAIGAVMRDVILIDADGDGRYDGADDRWIALRPERAKATRTLKKPDAMRLAEPQIPFLEDGRALMVGDVARDGSSLVLRLDRPQMEMADVLQRRYDEVRATHFQRFARERAAFMTRKGLDGKRPRTSTPAPWLDVPLSEAKATARKSGRPLLVHFFTESNPWCFRSDYYTFPDGDVDELLRRFVLVRIDAEKDPERSYAKSGARGLPVLVPLTAEGRPVTFRVRSRDEKNGRVADLKENERMITGWQRPQELKRNLERILKAAGAD
ncbi:MAG: thioredoxin family protein, partial [Planctomycetota bacterium]